jgi:hypothetical protein
VGLNPRFCCKQTTSLPFTKTPHFCLNFNSKKNVWQQLFILIGKALQAISTTLLESVCTKNKETITT